ncbi:MAG: ParB family protein [Photobacterium frigidiphilum]|uniref:ParB family protein n=1 Tax=Photobacterium frigidiphilum TaxID=264736 RepID=UPI0030033856
MLRPQEKRTGFKQGNQLSKLAKKEIMTKVLTFASGASVNATRVVIDADAIESKTVIHALNPRRQSSLTLDSVRDILPSIKDEGVHTEGVAIINSQGVYELLDSSRRRFSCLLAKKSLPLWVIDNGVIEGDLVAFINTTQAVKGLSYRELGASYPAIMSEKGLNNINELAEYLNLGRETCRKRYVAAVIADELIKIFPDCEGIPNSFYVKIAKVEKVLKKMNYSVSDFVHRLDLRTVDGLASIEGKQKAICDLMSTLASTLDDGDSKKLVWATESLAEFDEKNKYAKVSRSSDNRCLKIELSRLSPELYVDLVDFLKTKISD